MVGIDGCTTEDVGAVADYCRVGQDGGGRGQSRYGPIAGQFLVCLFGVGEGALRKGRGGAGAGIGGTTGRGCS